MLQKIGFAILGLLVLTMLAIQVFSQEDSTTRPRIVAEPTRHGSVMCLEPTTVRTLFPEYRTPSTRHLCLPEADMRRLLAARYRYLRLRARQEERLLA